MLNNSKGSSFLEALLAITIFFLIASLILPQFTKLQEELQHQKVQMHATEVAFNAARLVRDFNEVQGFLTIEQTRYDWKYEQNQICVSYTYEGEFSSQCIGS